MNTQSQDSFKRARRDFEDEYRWLNPPPRREDFAASAGEEDAGPWMGRPWTIIFLVVISIVISGLRTAQLFGELSNSENHAVFRIIEAVMAVGLVEVGIVLTGFRAEKLRRENLLKPRHIANLRDLWRGLRVRLGLAEPLTHAERPEPSIIPPLHNALFWAALIANVWVSVKVALEGAPGVIAMDAGAFFGALSGQPVEMLAQLAAAILVGAAPPVAAKAAGEAAARDMFGVLNRDAQDETAHQEALSAWHTSFKQAWTREKKKLEARKPAQQSGNSRPRTREDRQEFLPETREFSPGAQEKTRENGQETGMETLGAAQEFRGETAAVSPFDEEFLPRPVEFASEPEMLIRAIAELPEKTQAQILACVTFYSRYPAATLQELGEHLDVSTSRAGAVRKYAIECGKLVKGQGRRYRPAAANGRHALELV